MEIITKEESTELLKIARNIMERSARKEMLGKPKNYPEKLDKNFGILCILKKDSDVRGQIVVGFPVSLFSILDATISAVTALTSECNLLTHELNEIKIELSILTEPELMRFNKKEEILENIKQNIDGLLLRYGIFESFLPPQAWTEIKEKEAFLDKLCEKAGVEKETWREADIELYKFQAQIIEED
ncbi:MAG: AMMECR1 domain-containing protein [Candidatus Aenigmarchaeota archaeon]|nr:AMMECR1 domain-containing protein [Candidatus Aenigmarchaeota archaeon]